MPQSFRPLTAAQEHNLLARGEESTSTLPQGVDKAENLRVPRVCLHQEDARQSPDDRVHCHLTSSDLKDKLLSTPLFSCQDLQFSTSDVIKVLGDTLNSTSGSLSIPAAHVTEDPPQNLKGHSPKLHVVDSMHNLVTSSSIDKCISSIPRSKSGGDKILINL
jgi:hypothetical protein